MLNSLEGRKWLSSLPEYKAEGRQARRVSLVVHSRIMLGSVCLRPLLPLPSTIPNVSSPPPSGILHTVATTFLSLSPPACLAPSPAAAFTLRPRRPLLHGPGNDGLRSGSGQQQQQQEGEDARHRVPGPDGPAAQRAGEEVAQTQGPRRSHCEGRAQKGMM